MPTACCVIGCRSRGNGQPGIQFFQLPLNKPQVLTQWLIVLDRRDWIPKPSSKICSLHFASDDYLVRTNTNVPRLKPDAIPSVFPDLTEGNIQDDRESSPPPKENEFEEDNEDEDSETEGKEKINEVKEVIEVYKVNETGKVHEAKFIKAEKNVRSREPLTQIATPLLIESPSQRPRRTSKLNPRMKDYILLDDIKKHRHNSYVPSLGKPQPSEKEKAAQELLSILEDSTNSGDESSVKVNKSSPSSSKVAASVASKAISIENLASIDDAKKAKTAVLNNLSPKSTSTSTKIFKKKKIVSGTPTQLSGKTNIGESKTSTEDDVPEVVPVIRRKVATKSTGRRALAGRNVKSKTSDSSRSKHELQNGNMSASEGEDTSSLSSDSVGIQRKGVSKAKLSRPHPKAQGNQNVPGSFRKTYFQIKDGERSYYFSYADLNPIVDMTKNNPLWERNDIPSSKQSSEVDSDDNFDFEPFESNNDDNLSDTKEMDESDDDYLPNADSSTAKRANKKKPSKKEALLDINTKGTPKIKIKKRALESNVNINENAQINGDATSDESSMHNITLTNLQDDGSTKLIDKAVLPPGISKISKSYKVTSPIKRKKRFKTVAEIVVRTDNTGQVPSVSIDQINNLIDIENETPPRKKAKKTKITIPCGTSDFTNPCTVTKLPDESNDLDRLSRQITDTIKKLKLLDKVKGNASKLTVLITALPPVEEKEILIIKKKNLESNTEQSLELEVAISNYKSKNVNSGEEHSTNPSGSPSLQPPFIPIIGAWSKDVAQSQCETKDEKAASVQQDSDTAVTSSSGECLTIEIGKDSRASIGVENSCGEKIHSETIICNLESAGGKGGEDSSGVQVVQTIVPLQHDHTYMTMVSPTNKGPGESEVPTADQVKEVCSSIRLEDEIAFRTKASQKIRLLKETVKRKNEALNKAKEKLKFLEKTLRDERRTKKRFVKLRRGGEGNSSYGVIESDDLVKSVEYGVNGGDLQLEFEENMESEEDDRGSSPITYICEPAIDVCEKPNPNRDR